MQEPPEVHRDPMHWVSFLLLLCLLVQYSARVVPIHTEMLQTLTLSPSAPLMWYLPFIMRTDWSFTRSLTWARRCSRFFQMQWFPMPPKTWEHLERQRLRVKDVMAMITFTMILASSFFPSSRLYLLKTSAQSLMILPWRKWCHPIIVWSSTSREQNDDPTSVNTT